MRSVSDIFSEYFRKLWSDARSPYVFRHMEDKASDAVSAFEEDLENQIELFTGEGSTQMETIEANSEAASEGIGEEDERILTTLEEQVEKGNECNQAPQPLPC